MLGISEECKLNSINTKSLNCFHSFGGNKFQGIAISSLFLSLYLSLASFKNNLGSNPRLKYLQQNELWGNMSWMILLSKNQNVNKIAIKKYFYGRATLFQQSSAENHEKFSGGSVPVGLLCNAIWKPKCKKSVFD